MFYVKADLHVHSTYSDGADSVYEVLQKAAHHGVNYVSFVDHDSTMGLGEKQALGAELGIKVIPGIEISAYDFKRKRKVHILGYHYHEQAKHIEALCQPIRERRRQHTLWQIEQLKRVGYRLDQQAIISSALPSLTVYKQHVMNYLTTSAYTSDAYQQLYQSLFKGNGPASGDIEYVDAFDAVKGIVADGGLAVVAHPGQLHSYDIIPELVEVGLGGIERNHPDHTKIDYQHVEELANTYQLIMTGGTDYHGAFGTPITVGSIVSPQIPIERTVNY